jgi:hypothetical protein
MDSVRMVFHGPMDRGRTENVKRGHDCRAFVISAKYNRDIAIKRIILNAFNE